MAFWEGFSDSFFREADRAIQRERQRELDEQNRQRFEWEKEQQALQAQLRGLRKKLADDLWPGGADASGAAVAQAPQATGFTAPSTEGLIPASPQATGLRVPRSTGVPRPDPQATGFTAPSVEGLIPASPQVGATGLTVGPASPGAARRSLSPQEVADRVAALAALSGDYTGMFSAQDRAAQERLKTARQAEYKRLQGLKDEEIAQLFKEVNADGSGVPAMVDFDPKTRKYLLVSQVPGVPSQTLSRAEMLQGLMAAWEAGNGDYTQGIKAMVESAQAQRDLRDRDFERSRALAAANADAYFRGLAADNDAIRTSIARQGLGLQQSRAAAESWQPIGVTDDKRGLVFYNRNTRQMEVEPVPAGVDAVTWFRRITGEGAPKAFNPADYANTVKSFVDAGMPPAEALRRADQLYGRAPDVQPQALLELLQSLNNQAGQQRGAGAAPAAPPAPRGVNARLGASVPELERLVRGGFAPPPPPPARPDWSQVEPQAVPYGLPGWRLAQ